MKSILVLTSVVLLISHSSSLDPQLCNTNGPVCSGCNEVVYCLQTSEGYEVNHLSYCSESETCLMMSCTDARNPLCGEESQLEFTCNDVGMFPDPFDCHKYHFCVPNSEDIVNYPGTCESGYGYNPETLACDMELLNNVCPFWPIPLCSTVGQNGAFTSNKRYFYICADYSETVNIIYPHLYMCPNGGSYEDYQCVTSRRERYATLMAMSRKS